MYSMHLLFYCTLLTLTSAFYLSDRLRQIRQAADSSASQVTRKPRPLELPAGYDPYPTSHVVDSIAPTFPLAHSYSNGLDVNPGNINYAEGTLNVPIPGWGMWDLKARQIHGPQTTWMNYGHLVQPVNMFNLTPSEMNDMISNPAYQEARANAKAQPVMTLPGGFVPATCKPPMCNPFIHQVGAGFQALPGQKNRQYDGLLDFPVPTGPNGQNVRFPLQGNFVAGKSPFMYTHGHVINPVNPFPGYKPYGADSNTQQGTSLLEQTNGQSSMTGSSFANDDGPVNLPPLPPRSG